MEIVNITNLKKVYGEFKAVDDISFNIEGGEVFDAQTFSNFFRFPMLFLCGLFVPIEQLPNIIKPISFCLHLTYGTDVLNGRITGKSILNTMFSIFMMLVFVTLLFYLCQRNIKKKWIL